MIATIGFLISFLGAFIIDTFAPWSFTLLLLIILFDGILALKDRVMRYFSLVHVLGLIAGYLYAAEVAAKHDISGAFTMVFVIGVWAVLVGVFHIWYAVSLVHEIGRRELC